MFWCQWVLYSSCIQRHDYRFIDEMWSKVKGCGPSTEGQWKVYDSEFISPLCTNAPKPFLVLIWVWLNWCEKRFITDLLPRTLSGFLVEIDEFHTGSWFSFMHIRVFVPDEIGNNPLDYMEVQILDTLSARMTRLPKDVDHLLVTLSKHYVR